ncbi:hypothetical protein BU23DRAFT_651285 [Bimuria novae-zelandiae CBS 107.79]|uniref:FAD-binding FR-type domain-containing protein n=1 Tax=Bimuria novae-zelandiae CBS 107.79 TaxID=1447943 RepID=A0A6A5VZA3_9PLEO|nr:hypothetical protein BU23DRAFT_651285 [Bimuria novae-zelandiae CBS 107.79]
MAVVLSWLEKTLRISLSGAVDALGRPSNIGTEGEAVPDDPGKDPRFRKLAESVLFGRKLRLALRKRWVARKRSKGEEVTNEAWSSSSSTIEGTSTPPNAPSKKVDDVDERSPLLSTTPSGRRISTWKKPYYLCKAFMQYQPRPIPIINRILPTHATSLCVLAYNQPLKFLTGYSYENLNIFHRRAGELMCFEAFLHFAGMFIVWFGVLRKIGFTLARFLFNKLVILGLLAFISYEILYFTSLGSFRQRMYEVFLALHIFFQIAGLAFLWFHFYTSRPYVEASLGIFIIGRLVFRLWLKSTTHPATLTVLDDDETVLLSANWDTFTRHSALVPKSMKHGWKPNDHTFLTLPALSRKQALQAHPFTIFSVAPTLKTDEERAHAWFSLLIRAQAKEGDTGFTRHLLAYARSHPRTKSASTGLIAGGSGKALAYPLLYALLEPSADLEGGTSSRVARKVKLLWITHKASHRSWIPVDKWDELLSWGLEAHTPPPTTAVGRPDVPSSLRTLVGHGRTGVVVSGPDGLVRDVRNTCAKLIGSGADVQVQVEKFGW